MTYVPVILAREQGKWGEHGLICAALRFTVIRAQMKWAHEGVLWIFTIGINSFEQLDWDPIKCADTSVPTRSPNSVHAICHNKTLHQL